MLLYYLNKFRWVFIILGGVGVLYTMANYYESKGYNRAVVEIQHESATKIAEATAKAVNAAEIEIQKALDRQRLLFDNDLARAKRERIVEVEFKEIIREVEKIVYVESDCNVISDHGIRLLNKAVNNANRTTSDKR